MSEDFLTPRQLAARWSLVLATLKQWRCSGKGPLYHKLNGRIRYRIEDIQEFEKEKLRLHTSMPEPPSLNLLKLVPSLKETKILKKASSKRNRRLK
jgi:hypothetical protein